MSQAIIEVHGLEVGYGRHQVLKDLSFELPEGSVAALLGRNSCGKTTFLRTLAGLLPRQAGSVSVLGLDPAKQPVELRRRVGFAADSIEPPPWMRVRDWLRFLETFFPTWSREEETLLLERLRLDSSQSVKNLSKGARTKLSLLGALAHRPRLGLLDEPFSGLDPVIREEVASAIVGHLREESRTILLSSHSFADVERVADRVALLRDGRIAMSGELEAVVGSAARFEVQLCDGENGWSPPGSPWIERRGNQWFLTYSQISEREEAELVHHPKIASCERKPVDLERLMRSAMEETAR